MKNQKVHLIEDPKTAGDRVMAGLVKITDCKVQGAHDADFLILGDRAYIVAEVNDKEPGEDPCWPFIYVMLSIVNIPTGAIEKIIPFARSEQAFANASLPKGACFVPRIWQVGPNRLRCFFASESPGERESLTWFIDFDVESMTFENSIHPAWLKTSLGTFEMRPKYFHEDARRHGFEREAKDYGLYLVDSFKEFDGKVYAALNNFPSGQNALAVMNDGFDTFEVLGHFNDPQSLRLTESGITRMPDSSWLAVCRQDGGEGRYVFSTSTDGRQWSPGEYRDVIQNGGSSKPTLDRLNGQYFLGWQDAEKVNGVNRSIFNIEVSDDGIHWARRYRFESEKAFQYPMFKEHGGRIYVAVTQGDESPWRKERIMFGRLE
jgi:hypothetical protein